jgi:hypothetical protein
MGRLGAGFKPLIAADRPNSGGAIFAGNLIFSDKDSATFPALLTVACDSGEPVVTGIENAFDIV